ncbi:putative protein kinase RLK-Pelle-RLCK-VIIa-2 family [Helianthus annuus]|nr:putative protein kinase RLK-Pelle-RLCK-VIIa-2 family [Helianthus annuus]
MAKVNFLGHMDHPNIIRLLGYCNEEHEHLLVYEYMPNKSFEHCLFTDTSKGLSWETRLLIMIGVVRGLTYLHSMKLVCRGLKTGDILLDEDFNAKLRDFGLVKYGPEPGETHVTTMVMRTYGYAAPEYVTTAATGNQYRRQAVASKSQNVKPLYQRLSLSPLHFSPQNSCFHRRRHPNFAQSVKNSDHHHLFSGHHLHFSGHHLKNRGTYNGPQKNGAAMVLQLPRIKKRWESGEDGTAGWGLNLLPTRPRTRHLTCRLRKLGRKNPFPSLFQTPSFLNQLNNYLASQGKGKGKSKDYDSNNLFDNESDDEPNDNDDDE